MKERARVAMTMATTIRVAGNKEGKGGMTMVMATRMAGEWMAMAMKRAMATKMREEGKEEGNGKGSKSHDNGKEDSNGEQRQ
jgi:hypothetical protein